MKYPCVGTTVTVVFTVAAKGLSSDKYAVVIVGCGMVYSVEDRSVLLVQI